MIPTDSLDRQCQELGIMPHYRDYTGQTRQVPISVLRALMERLQPATAQTVLPPVIIHQNHDTTLTVTINRDQASAGGLFWEIESENGKQLNGEIDRAANAFSIAGPLPIGDYRLKLMPQPGGAVIAECPLIVAPRCAFMPASLQNGGRLWGLSVQLFSLRSTRNWGIGDFTDLLDLVGRAADIGAGLIGLNPLHALFPDRPDWASPYSPSSRCFLNFIYIDPEAMPEFSECDQARQLRRDPAFASKLTDLRAAPLVDYIGVAAAKLQMLHLLFQHFRDRHLAADDQYGQEFRGFQEEHGSDLRRFATFHALQEHFSALARDLRPWRRWPEEYRDPTSAAVSEFVRAHRSGIEFFEYLQWHAHRQLSICAKCAREVGMPIGLYQDIAVGVDQDSAEAWSSQDYLVDGWSIGAPPDNWNPLGQNWGTPPPHPQRMKETAYAAFRQALRANMRASGAVRIDHVLGLMRLFWVPAAADAREGAYIRYPMQDLLAIVALESQRNRCLVIGEDLGTIPEGFQDALAAAGILSYRLLYFERDKEGCFKPPVDWPAQALAAATTHDLPTLPGYWCQTDIDLKARLNFYTSPEMEVAERQRREADRRQLVAALQAEGLGTPLSDELPVEAAYRYLARTPSKILMLQFEDMLGITEQMNMPGTTSQHPNWRRKLPMAVAAMMADPKVAHVIAAVARERKSTAISNENRTNMEG